MTGANVDRAPTRIRSSGHHVMLPVGSALRTIVICVGFAVLVTACAGIRPAPVLPIDPIYEPDTTPIPSDAPLIEPPAGEASEPVIGSSSPEVPVDRGASPAEGGGGASTSTAPGATVASRTGAANNQAQPASTIGSGASPVTGSPAAGSPVTGSPATGSSVPGLPAAGSAPPEERTPEHVALAPSTLSPALSGRTGAAGAPRNEAASGAPQESAEDLQLVKLLADLQRYGSFTGEELKRELTSATAALARQRTDANRIRVGVLYSLIRTSSQDDQHALQLFEAVAKDAPPTSPMRHLATILQAQVLERQRAVKFEQQKGDAAIQKLEALRAMEQSLFRDRVRGGGGGGGGGGGSGR